jgi:hypothetical protein
MARRTPIVARSHEQSNVAPLDGWTLVHVAWGGIAGGLGMNPWAFLAATAAYEVLEFVHESPSGSTIFGSKRPESPANMLMDVGVAAVAYGLARHIRDR